MSISRSISRFADYWKRNGLRATVRRLGLATTRALFSNRMVLFYCDLSALSSPPADMPSSVKVKRHTNQTNLSPQDLQEITSFWNPELARRKIKERFDLGASLWLIKFEGNLAGYGWTLQGRTVEPHYFPLGKDDVQFLDFHVFPKYRGRALDWFLMTHALHTLAAEGRARAYGEAAEWNRASLASFGMTPFRPLGWARKYTVLGRTIVSWHENQAAEPKQGLKKQSVPATGRKGSTIPDTASLKN
jgi:ribosomal protein S18 acetylase RimI-like enzyme